MTELGQILANIEAASPQGAQRVRTRIKSIVDLIALQPYSGQRTSLSDLRRMVVTPYPYLIFYKPSKAAVLIIGIRHGARDPSSMPDQ